MSPFTSRKGKERAFGTRDAGGGVVLPLDMVGTGYFDVAYTVAIQIGTSSQNLSLQVDTGSSDLWIASTSCSSSACSGAKGHLYDPSEATQTGETFDIDYLKGHVSGPIVWDQVSLGGYSVDEQAIAAATQVDSEPLASNYDGILGLALPSNSIISSVIHPTTSDAPDGAAFASNLFSISPVTDAPPARFLSLSLKRPPSDRIQSYLGVGAHPEDIVKDPSQISYSSLAQDGYEQRFWRASIMEINVYVDGDVNTVNMGTSRTGQAYPTAVLDSGVPVILTTSTIANGIYGALGIGPSGDGTYYVPCSTPLNMTITLLGQPEMPLHPLDLTAEPLNDPSSSSCVGLIQSADQMINDPNSDTGDMVLGVPFLRNMYTVMAYDPPNDNGSFTPSVELGPREIEPRLGLMALTDAGTALSEFNTVRIDRQPLTGQGSTTAGGATSNKAKTIGIDVLIGIVSFFGFCFVLFGLRWAIMRRKYRDAEPVPTTEEGLDKDASYAMYRLSQRASNASLGLGLGSEDDGPSEDTLRTMRYEAYIQNNKLSQYSTDTASTKVGDPEVGEFGDLKSTKVFVDNHGDSSDDEWNPYHSLPRTPDQHSEADPESPPPLHHRRPSATPLLTHFRSNSNTSDAGQRGEVDSPLIATLAAPVSNSRLGSSLRNVSTIDDSSDIHLDLRVPTPARTVTASRPPSRLSTASRSPPRLGVGNEDPSGESINGHL